MIVTLSNFVKIGLAVWVVRLTRSNEWQSLLLDGVSDALDAFRVLDDDARELGESLLEEDRLVSLHFVDRS